MTKLRLIRENLGLSQTDMADRCKVSLTTYAPIERGVMVPSKRVGQIIEREVGLPLSKALAPIRIRQTA